jgi:hypothetical protein
VEIAWALDLQLRVRDFRFQRCRGAGCESLPTGPFLDAIRGRDLSQIKELLSAQGSSLSHGITGVSEAESPLAVTVLRSAAKTIAVTGKVWGDDLAQLH